VPEDVAVCESRIDHGGISKHANPMQNVGFCDFRDEQWQRVNVPATSVSTFLAPLHCYQVHCGLPLARAHIVCIIVACRL
jgi:hypothetical protein